MTLMDPLPIFALAIVATLFAFNWHNEPARVESSVRGDDSVSGGAGAVDRGTVVLWSFAVLTFAALFLAGCLIWIKCAGDSAR